MKPAIIILYFLFCFSNISAEAKVIPLFNEFGAGLDISQFNNYIAARKPKVNFGIVGFYNPYKFLKFNMATYVNSVGDLHGGSYKGLETYRSTGFCVKMGPELSLKIRKHSKRNKRLTWGYDLCLASFRERGEIRIKEPYWGDYVKSFDTKRKFIKLWQYTLGYQVNIRRVQLKLQAYVMFEQSYSDLKLVNKVVQNYQPVFVPGFGYSQGGLNVCLYYRM